MPLINIDSMLLRWYGFLRNYAIEAHTHTQCCPAQLQSQSRGAPDNDRVRGRGKPHSEELLTTAGCWLDRWLSDINTLCCYSQSAEDRLKGRSKHSRSHNADYEWITTLGHDNCLLSLIWEKQCDSGDEKKRQRWSVHQVPSDAITSSRVTLNRRIHMHT